MYEMRPLIKASHLKSKDSWEQSRMIAYIIAQSNSQKRLKPSDIISFAWDEEKPNDNTSVSNDDVERIMKKADELIKYL